MSIIRLIHIKIDPSVTETAERSVAEPDASDLHFLAACRPTASKASWVTRR
jgi:hypothetical protein